jgi:hypothetical protein
MDFLKIKTTWSALELGCLKISTTSAGIVFGMYFCEELENSFNLICGIFVFTSIIAIYLWVKKVRIEQ